MKKYILIIICSMFIITGCSSNKEIVCTKEVNDNNGVITKIENTYKFEENKLTTINNKTTYVIDEDKSNISINDYSESLKNELEGIYGKYESTKIKVEKDTESVTSTININYKNIKDEEKEEIFTYESDNYKDLLTELKNDKNLTCIEK